MALIPNDSPLRRVPKSVDRRIILFLDGVRYSIECYELASMRLTQSLEAMSRLPADADFRPLIVAATSDACTMVDTAHRLLGLLDHAPRMKKSQPELQLFLRGTKEVENLRHFFQHLGQKITDFSKRRRPLWGIIKWVAASDHPDERISHVIVPGTFDDQAEIPGMTFDTHEFRFIGRVVLEAGGTEIDLVDLDDLILRFIIFYTDWFGRTFTGDDHYDADRHIQYRVMGRRRSIQSGGTDGPGNSPGE
ncbi:MAG TPA: hypothetical protein VGP76_11360 [Planctomycetaceae bacterium]|jgi:hypothetical protein|nr:hypothetical protein [Planctomycetaceae bacterium]